MSKLWNAKKGWYVKKTSYFQVAANGDNSHKSSQVTHNKAGSVSTTMGSHTLPPIRGSVGIIRAQEGEEKHSTYNKYKK